MNKISTILVVIIAVQYNKLFSSSVYKIKK